MQKYILDFDGTVGDFIKFWRKVKKINSKELSKIIGKSDSYISHLENNRNKNPDYDTLFEIFKRIGIEEIKIEDYLEYFGFLSPQREAADEAQMIARMNPTAEDFEEMEREAEYYRNLENKETQDKKVDVIYKSYNNGDVLLDDILTENIKSIVYILHNMAEHDINNAFNIITGLSKVFDDVSTNENLYKFMNKFYSEKVSSLDEIGMVNVINTLYEELNRIDREKTAFGKPRQRTGLTKL